MHVAAAATAATAGPAALKGEGCGRHDGTVGAAAVGGDGQQRQQNHALVVVMREPVVAAAIAAAVAGEGASGQLCRALVAVELQEIAAAAAAAGLPRKAGGWAAAALLGSAAVVGEVPGVQQLRRRLLAGPWRLHGLWRLSVPRCARSAECAGQAPPPPLVVAIAMPHPAALHFALVWQWARVARAYGVRRSKLLGDMAVAQTMGGGWACLRNVRESSRWAVRLFRLARELGDEASMRKCRVFVAYAFLWLGDRGASSGMLDDAAREAIAVGDEVQLNRCVAAAVRFEHTIGEGFEPTLRALRSYEETEELEEQEGGDGPCDWGPAEDDALRGITAAAAIEVDPGRVALLRRHIAACWAAVFGGEGSHVALK